MPWTKTKYPPSMKNLNAKVRNKAVEIANSLLDEGYAEGRAIAIATAQAEKWADVPPKGDQDSAEKSTSSKRSTHSKSKSLHGEKV